MSTDIMDDGEYRVTIYAGPVRDDGGDRRMVQIGRASDDFIRVPYEVWIDMCRATTLHLPAPFPELETIALNWNSHPRAIKEVLIELARQKTVYPPGFPANRTGIRAAICAGQDELNEAYHAWCNEKGRVDTVGLTPDGRYPYTTVEMIQAAAVIIYGLDCIFTGWREKDE